MLLNQAYLGFSDGGESIVKMINIVFMDSQVGGGTGLVRKKPKTPLDISNNILKNGKKSLKIYQKLNILMKISMAYSTRRGKKLALHYQWVRKSISQVKQLCDRQVRLCYGKTFDFQNFMFRE